MDFLDLVRQRQSDRSFDKDKPVEEDKIMALIEAARLAPSACNGQPWKFIIVDDPQIKDKVAKCCVSNVLLMNHFTQQAPLHIVVVEEKTNLTSGIGCKVKHKDFKQMDIGIAAENICLTAASLGLGSCMVGWFNEDKMKEILNIPKDRRIWLDIVIGYPTKPTREKKRKSIEQICSRNKY